MKKIRIGNDFVFNWAIERGGLPEDLSSVLEKHLHLSVFGKRVELIEGVDYDITGNVIRIEVIPAIANIIGTYKAEFHYILPDNGLIDEDRKCAVDVDAFQIVAKTAQADDSTEFSMTSDMAIAFKGDKGDKGDSAYKVWLEEGNIGTEEDYFAYLRQPAVDAGASISELEGEIQVNESLRIQAESEREQAESERQITIQEAVTATNLANEKANLANTAAQSANEAADSALTATQEATTAASLADTARLSIQDDLALKANQTDLAASQKSFTQQVLSNIYKKTQTVIGANAAIISSAFKGLYISGVRDITKKYFLTVVRRNVSGASQIQIYSALATDITQNRTSVARWDSDGGDPNLNKVVKISFGSTTPCIAFIDWSKIPDGASYTQMFEGYELDDKCFDQNQYDLAASITANTNAISNNTNAISNNTNAIDHMKNSVLYKMEFSLTEGGFINGNTGGISTAPNISYTDFLPVKPGQTIHYKGYNFGNATLCGYSKDKTSFVNLLTTPGSISLMDIDIIIPDNIYYIRGCTYKVNNTYLLEITPDFNYDFLDKEIKEVIDSQPSDTINNMIQDPYFKYGIMLTAVDPQLIAFGGAGAISLSNGEAINKDARTTAKGMQIMARFSQGWATKFGLKAGDTIRVGAYIKAVVGSGSTVTGYGTRGRNDITADKITYIGTNNSLPLDSYTDWQWIERTLTLKTDGTDIDQATDFSLGYIQLTDPGAATNPTELRIKQPCILFNPPAAASGFYESKRSQQMDYLFVNFLSIMSSLSIGGDLSVNNLIFNGSQVESTFLTMTTEKAKIRWVELSDNYDFPSKGIFIGRQNEDVAISINGVITKLNS